MKNIPVIIFGVGGVGRTLLKQIISGRENTASRNQVQFDVVAVADSSNWAFDPAGLSDDALMDIVKKKLKREAIGEARPSAEALIQQVADTVEGKGIVVDITAIDGMEPALDTALANGYGVVLANKKALAAPWESAQKYFNNLYVRHESTVGGGQPVVGTMRYLCDTNDEVYQVEGQFSGTLGYLCQRLDEGVKISQAIGEAKAKGYTEPDPREDLGGLDVMRKALILGRMAGWPLEESDIDVESLYPASLQHLSIPEFMAASVSLDPSMADRVTKAAEAGTVLRYLATVTSDGGKVGLQPMETTNALANLKFISFDSANYHDENLVICGKGAGVEMTAAGVVGDMIDLAREML